MASQDSPREGSAVSGDYEDLRAKVRQRMVEDGIPVGTDHQTLLAEGAPPLHRRVRMQTVMDGVPAGKATEAVNNGHPAGDCLRACIASVFNLDPDDVPHFVQYVEHPAGTDSHLWWWALVGFGAAHGWRIDYVTNEDDIAPMGWALADGKSQRGHSHVVVCHDRKLLWDPHPSDAWLVAINGWFTLERLCPHGHPLCDGRPTTCLVRESEALGLYDAEEDRHREADRG